MINKFLVQTTETIRYDKASKKPPATVGYFCKTAEFFSNALTAQSAQKQNARFI